jgi:hypothetical protein
VKSNNFQKAVFELPFGACGYNFSLETIELLGLARIPHQSFMRWGAPRDT